MTDCNDAEVKYRSLSAINYVMNLKCILRHINVICSFTVNVRITEADLYSFLLKLSVVYRFYCRFMLNLKSYCNKTIKNQRQRTSNLSQGHRDKGSFTRCDLFVCNCDFFIFFSVLFKALCSHGAMSVDAICYVYVNRGAHHIHWNRTLQSHRMGVEPNHV